MRHKNWNCISNRTMQDLLAIWLSLLACLAVIGVAGVWLSRYGDIISEKSKLSRGWVGLILLLRAIYLLNTQVLYLYG